MRNRQNGWKTFLVTAMCLAGCAGDASESAQVSVSKPARVPQASRPPAEARFMLQTAGRENHSPGEENKTAEDFTWSRLAAGSLATGKPPIVGPGSGLPYYDFKDGQPYPFYVIRPRG